VNPTDTAAAAKLHSEARRLGVKLHTARELVESSHTVLSATERPVKLRPVRALFTDEGAAEYGSRRGP